MIIKIPAPTAIADHYGLQSCSVTLDGGRWLRYELVVGDGESEVVFISMGNLASFLSDDAAYHHVVETIAKVMTMRVMDRQCINVLYDEEGNASFDDEGVTYV